MINTFKGELEVVGMEMRVFDEFQKQADISDAGNRISEVVYVLRNPRVHRR